MFAETQILVQKQIFGRTLLVYVSQSFWIFISFHQYTFTSTFIILRHILAVSFFKSHSVSDVITSISSLVFHNKSYSVPSIVLEIYFLKDFVTVSTFPLSYYFIHTWHSMYSFLFIIELFTIHQTVFLFYAIFQVIIPSFK